MIFSFRHSSRVSLKLPSDLKKYAEITKKSCGEISEEKSAGVSYKIQIGRGIQMDFGEISKRAPTGIFEGISGGIFHEISGRNYYSISVDFF